MCRRACTILNNHSCTRKILAMKKLSCIFFFFGKSPILVISNIYQKRLHPWNSRELHSYERRQGVLCTTRSMQLTHLSETVTELSLFDFIQWNRRKCQLRPNLGHSPVLKMERFSPAARQEYSHHCKPLELLLVTLIGSKNLSFIYMKRRRSCHSRMQKRHCKWKEILPQRLVPQSSLYFVCGNS